MSAWWRGFAVGTVVMGANTLAAALWRGWPYGWVMVGLAVVVILGEGGRRHA